MKHKIKRDKKKNAQLGIRMSLNQKQHLHAMAMLNGISISEYALRMLFPRGNKKELPN